MNSKNRISEANQLQHEINNMRPLRRRVLKQLKNYYRVELTYSGNALEDNISTSAPTP